MLNKTNLNQELFKYSTNGNLDKVKFTLSQGADINATNSKEYTALHMAVDEGHLDIVKHLIEQGANVNAKNKYESTPLHQAVFFGRFEIAKYLIAHGADVNAKMRFGIVPLRTAINNSRFNIAEHLIQKGANPYIKVENTTIIDSIKSRPGGPIKENLLNAINEYQSEFALAGMFRAVRDERNKLPIEITKHISQYMDTNTISNVSKTCKSANIHYKSCYNPTQIREKMDKLQQDKGNANYYSI